MITDFHVEKQLKILCLMFYPFFFSFQVEKCHLLKEKTDSIIQQRILSCC